jgi:hypothetical protein
MFDVILKNKVMTQFEKNASDAIIKIQAATITFKNVVITITTILISVFLTLSIFLGNQWVKSLEQGSEKVEFVTKQELKEILQDLHSK